MKFPLGQNIHDLNDIQKMIDVLLTEKFTMGENVLNFEKKFAEFIGCKYAVMVNSGSSANLLALSILTNFKYLNKLNSGDEVLVPALCWSTTVFPIIQCNLIPKFVDVDPVSLNIDLNDLEKKITPKTKAIMLVHVLGNCTDMLSLLKIIEKHKIFLIEDTCESLGSKFNNKYLGNFGDIGTYSFYYSHHLTTMEGGMLISNNEEYYELAKCLRAHGWTRNLKNRENIESNFPDVDSRFTFVNLGYNFRPMEIQAAMGLSQLKKIEINNNNRKINYFKIKNKIKNDSRNNFITFPESSPSADIAWFGIALFVDEKISLKEYLAYLTLHGVENRPLITGNIIRQPVIKDLYPYLDPLSFKGAEKCHFNGLFIGLSVKLLSDLEIKELVDILLNFSP